MPSRLRESASLPVRQIATKATPAHAEKSSCCSAAQSRTSFHRTLPTCPSANNSPTRRIGCKDRRTNTSASAAHPNKHSGISPRPKAIFRHNTRHPHETSWCRIQISPDRISSGHTAAMPRRASERQSPFFPPPSAFRSPTDAHAPSAESAQTAFRSCRHRPHASPL